MLFLEFASVGPMLGQADISTLAQRRTNGWITIGMFTGIGLVRPSSVHRQLASTGFKPTAPIKVTWQEIESH